MFWTPSKSVLENVNPYAAAYKHMSEVEAEEHERDVAEGREPHLVRMEMVSGPDRRRYNAPLHDEVAAIFVGDNGEPPERDVIVHQRGGGLHIIKDISPNCDPMTYPLFFPNGEPGWSIGIPHQQEHRTATRNKVTMSQFYNFHLAIRNSFNPLHHGERLFQQYLVDAYVKVSV